MKLWPREFRVWCLTLHTHSFVAKMRLLGTRSRSTNHFKGVLSHNKDNTLHTRALPKQTTQTKTKGLCFTAFEKKYAGWAGSRNL